MTKSLLPGAVLVLALSSPALATIEYQCPNSADFAISATIYDEEGIAIVTSRNLHDGSTSEWRLEENLSASGASYQGQGTVMSASGLGPAQLTFSNGYVTTCTVSSVQDPGQPAHVPGQQEVVGISFGGNLRDGPGTNFRDVGSLQENDQVVLVSDTGVFMNGYSWWVIRVNGRQAYQWGGLLCAPGHTMTGIFNQGC